MFISDMTFYFSGAIGKNITNKYQLRIFDETVTAYGGDAKTASQSWNDAFGKLRKLGVNSDVGRLV